MARFFLVTTVFTASFLPVAPAFAQFPDVLSDAVEAIEQAKERIQKQTDVDADEAADDDPSNAGDKRPEKVLSVGERFEEFASEIEKEMDRRELEGNKSLKTVRKLQDEQREIYRACHAEIMRLAAERMTKATRNSIADQSQKQRLAGARLNELELQAEKLLASSSNSHRNNQDLMTKLNGFSRDLSREDRTEFQRDSKAQRRFGNLMQKVMSRRVRHYSQRGFRDLTKGLVADNPTNGVRYPDHPGAQEGSMQEARSALNKILSLTWQGDHVTIDRRHWDNLFAGRSPEEMEQDVEFLLQKQNVSVPKADQHGMPFNRGISQHNVLRLFDNLRHEFGNSGRSSSTSGANVSVSFSNQVASAELQLTGGSFRFEFRERTSPRRLLMVNQSNDGLSITLFGEVVLRFHQRGDGTVSIVETMGETLTSRNSESFGRLYLNDPEFIETRLFPLLHHVGIVPPASRFDPSVVDRVVERLTLAMQTEDVELAHQLIEELDSDEFQVRQAASKRLEAKVEQYRELLVAAANADDASFERRSRIKFLLDKNSLASGDSDGLISSLRLMDDPVYLAIIMQQLDDVDFPPLAKRLEVLTGEMLGTDVDAWRRWVSTNRNEELVNRELKE